MTGETKAKVIPINKTFDPNRVSAYTQEEIARLVVELHRDYVDVVRVNSRLQEDYIQAEKEASILKEEKREYDAKITKQTEEMDGLEQKIERLHTENQVAQERAKAALIELDEQKKENERLKFCNSIDEALNPKKDGKPDDKLPIYNKTAIYSAGETMMKIAQRYKKPISVLFLDIDYFKKINDTWGHNKGDDYLKKVAYYLVTNVREADLTSRYGGEEFLMIMPETKAKDAHKSAENLRVGIENLFNKQEEYKIKAKSEGLQYNTDNDLLGAVTISIGVATFDPTDTTLQDLGIQKFEDLIKGADAALYKSKEKGRNRVTAYEDISWLKASQDAKNAKETNKT